MEGECSPPAGDMATTPGAAFEYDDETQQARRAYGGAWDISTVRCQFVETDWFPTCTLTQACQCLLSGACESPHSTLPLSPKNMAYEAERPNFGLGQCSTGHFPFSAPGNLGMRVGNRELPGAGEEGAFSLSGALGKSQGSAGDLSYACMRLLQREMISIVLVLQPVIWLSTVLKNQSSRSRFGGEGLPFMLACLSGYCQG